MSADGAKKARLSDDANSSIMETETEAGALPPRPQLTIPARPASPQFSPADFDTIHQPSSSLQRPSSPLSRGSEASSFGLSHQHSVQLRPTSPLSATCQVSDIPVSVIQEPIVQLPPLPIPADQDQDEALRMDHEVLGPFDAASEDPVNPGEMQPPSDSLPENDWMSCAANWMSYAAGSLFFEVGGNEEEIESEINEEEMYSLGDDVPLYSGAPITLHESLVSILCLALAFSLSGQCIQALLLVINMHCLPSNKVFKSSLYLFKKYFSYLRGDVDYKYYCSKCFEKCEKSIGCVTCGKKAPLCCLISRSLAPQLQKMFKRKGFHSKLQYNRRAGSGLCDISDGKLYREHIERGILGAVYSLSLLWYTDGAALFKSSKISVWPVYLSICELPYSERFRKENLLVPALWCGPVQPPVNILMKEVHPDLMNLKDGITIEVEDEGMKKIKAIVLCGTGDTPARALMLNMVKHNGETSCQKCLQPGEPREDFPGVRLFPYRPAEMVPRTDLTLVRHGQLAGVLGRAYMGVKGTTILSKITASPVRGTSINSMHLLFSGIGKTNLKLFYDLKYSKLKCRLDVYKGIIDKRLLGIKPPFYLTRVPMSIDDCAIWKTSLHKSMFLYFGLVVLKGIVKDRNLEHFASLVAAVQYLNSDEVTPECLRKADLLIKKYVSYFEDFYGKELMTLSVHLLLHLVELVKELGPLWVTGCFPLEGVNGDILNLVHGTSHAEKQMSTSLETCLGLRDLVDNLKDTECKRLCEDMLSSTNKCKSTKIGNFSIVGKWEKLVSVPEYLVEPVHDNCNLDATSLFTFHSLRSNKMLYVAESCQNCLSRDASCAEFIFEGKTQVGAIKLFLRAALCDCTDGCSCFCNLFAVIEKLNVVEYFQTLIPEIPVPNTHGYERLNSFIILPVESLKSVCVKMNVGSKLYISKRCNQHETE